MTYRLNKYKDFFLKPKNIGIMGRNMSLAGHSFQQAATLQHPFTLTLGRMLVANNVITQDDYDLAGEAQARTVVIANVFETRPDLQPAIISAYPNKDKSSMDLNNVAFMYAKDTIVGELDGFLQGLALPDLDARLQTAKAQVALEKGVHERAAAAAVLHKGLFLNRDERQPMVEASLMMQMATRGLTRVQAIELGQFDRNAAMAMMNLHNKVNYKFDSEALSGLNEALLEVCLNEAAIQRMAMKAQAGQGLPFEIKNARETLLKQNVHTLIDAMPTAIGMYHQVGRKDLGDKAHQVYDASRAALNSYFIIPESGNLIASAAPQRPLN